MDARRFNQSKDDATAKAGASQMTSRWSEPRAAAAKFYEKQLAERDARIAALERMLKEKGVAVPEQKEKPAVTSAFDEELLDAAMKGDLAEVEALLAKGADAEAATKDGGPAALGGLRGHSAMVEMLAHGADVKAVNNDDPAARCGEKGNSAMVETLLAHGADVKAVNNDVQTPLHEAAMNGNSAMVETLLAHGATRRR